MADPQCSAALRAHPSLPPGAPRSGVLHVRHRHTDRFTVIGNHLAQHPRLSAVAIGLAVYIQSLPDGVSATIKALALRFREGEATISRALNELEDAGYLERRRVPLGGGRFATRTFFYDKPGCVLEEKQEDEAATATPSAAPATTQAARPTGQQPAPVPPPPAALPPAGAPIAVPPKPHSQPRPQARQSPAPAPVPPPTPLPPAEGPAADLLARLRLADPRLLLSTHDVRRLAPAVDTWLSRDAAPAQITRTLTANLPPASEPIHHPARFLEHRLNALLPPPLPAAQATAPTVVVAPFQTCDGCERAFRSHDRTALCRDCRPAAGAAA